MWIYISATPSQLAEACSGVWAPTKAYIVTPELAVELDDEEVTDEYVRDTAALASVMELGSPRRVVVVADVPESLVTPSPDRHPTAVDLSGAIPADAVVCAFIDEKAAEPDARAAAAGDDEAVTRLELRDMLWYDATEFAELG